VSRIIGNTLAFEIDDGIAQIDIRFLSSRLDAMAKNGRLKIRGGSAHDIRWSEVRLPEVRLSS
jgi:hypothetical protein